MPFRASHRARDLTETLSWLRLLAVTAQVATVGIVAYGFGLPIAVVPLLSGIGALALFALFAFWRLSQPWPLRFVEAFAHVAVDIVALAYLLYWSGGITNPFASLLVMPIALAAAALPTRYVASVALLAAGCFLLLVPLHVPLPPLPAGVRGQVNLHLAGLAINFMVTASVLAYFISRLARSLREREREVRHERERALRDEGILAIATQAAGTAHELNTPLSTIRTLLAELVREQAGNPALAADLALLAGQAERCRDILRELVAVGSRQLAGTAAPLPLGEFVRQCEDQFRLLRPEIALATRVGDGVDGREIAAAPDLRHALINLLSNAGDASRAAGNDAVELTVQADRDAVEFAVSDHGRGGAATRGTAFQTSKQHGLGLGLALAHATAERLHGALQTEPLPGGGLRQRLRVPLAAADNRHP